jgi:hypothetical protein
MGLCCASFIHYEELDTIHIENSIEFTAVLRHAHLRGYEDSIHTNSQKCVTQGIDGIKMANNTLPAWPCVSQSHVFLPSRRLKGCIKGPS